MTRHRLTYRETTITPGGLMRCCYASLEKWVAAHLDEPAVDGTVVPCTYERLPEASAVLDHGRWRWNRGDTKEGD